ncbi:leucyl aminopeptidase family protein [Salinicoccus halitifaciens]|uniref:Probable cytosol aminopeptidase n=1 Tax=Salinicoccus halitifaciens TaxID=1073415 RepID=A0ABV2EDI2_9STAP|nr:leucyl aminopeptidase family protein [Salinicoccus halitifaciens]MCD2138637.1 leucyl aminopeptidase family protein [Salinicoccus halitifaciens]
MNFKFQERYEASKDPIIIGLPERPENLPNFDEVDSLLNGVLRELINERVLSTEFGEITSTGVTIQTEVKKVVAIGLGKTGELTSHRIHKVFGRLFQYLKKKEAASASLMFDTFGHDVRTTAEAIGYMSNVSIFEYTGKKHQDENPFLTDFELTITSKEPVEEYVSYGRVIGESVNFARVFSETPPNFMTPEIMTEKISAAFKGSRHTKIDIKDEFDLNDEGYGLITAVGKASDNKPRLVTVEYRHPDAYDVKPVALVGKGITYDSGGYSIKGKTGMPGMKYDLSGAANVLGMIHGIMALELPVHVVATVVLAENMISGNAMKPDDVFTSLSGQTVEVKNTDAEGRLVLGDAVHHASQYSPRVIMDFATLTGAVIAAIGEERTGVFTNKGGDLIAPIAGLAEETGERLWRLPLDDIEEQKVKSSAVADLVNHVEKPGRASFAACFIRQFANGSPWIHFDIAGTATQSKANAYGPKGATGVLIRSVIKAVEGDLI